MVVVSSICDVHPGFCGEMVQFDDSIFSSGLVKNHHQLGFFIGWELRVLPFFKGFIIFQIWKFTIFLMVAFADFQGVW